MSIEKQIYIVIPVYNEATVIDSVISRIKKEGYDKIIVVDDGSRDKTFQKIKETNQVIALRHKINRGKGATVKTGIYAAKLLNADVVVTMDGDGQHNPKDIEHLITPIIEENVDVVLGTRLKDYQGMPLFRVAANKLSNVITWLLYGLMVTDSQSGFRAYDKKAIALINTQADRYDYDSEVIREIKKHNLKYKEVPIDVIYTDYSQGKLHRQGFVNGLKTICKMIWNLIS